MSNKAPQHKPQWRSVFSATPQRPDRKCQHPGSPPPLPSPPSPVYQYTPLKIERILPPTYTFFNPKKRLAFRFILSLIVFISSRYSLMDIISFREFSAGFGILIPDHALEWKDSGDGERGSDLVKSNVLNGCVCIWMNVNSFDFSQFECGLVC